MRKSMFFGAIGLGLALAVMAPILFLNSSASLVDALGPPTLSLAAIAVLLFAVFMPDGLVSSIGDSLWTETSLPHNNLTLPRDGHSDPGRHVVLKSVIDVWAFLVAIIIFVLALPPKTEHRVAA